jgi:hypothetical protein
MIVLRTHELRRSISPVNGQLPHREAVKTTEASDEP